MPKPSPIENDEAASGSPFSHVCKIEHPLGAAQRLTDALALITEAIDDPEASAMNEIVQMMKVHLGAIDTEYWRLFRLHHPDRERLENERDGWPDGKPEAE